MQIPGLCPESTCRPTGLDAAAPRAGVDSTAKSAATTNDEHNDRTALPTAGAPTASATPAILSAIRSFSIERL
jgi:hypothetical protein